MLWALTYTQDLNPLGNRVLSTFVAALPVLVLFYVLVFRRWLASKAGAAGAVTAIVAAWLAFGMPLNMAAMAFVDGAAFGLLPIGWTVFCAMLLYNITVETGQFTVIRRSVASLSGDARIQAILIGFAFGAFLEGAAGAGSPVAICGAMMVGLGFPPVLAAVICLVANTSPVAYGGLGVPILTLGLSSDLPAEAISIMAGHQLPILSCVIPIYMVKIMCSWRQTLEVWPALAVAGGSFAGFQFVFATMHNYVPSLVLFPMTDIGGGIFSLVVTAIFLRFWKPKKEWHYDAPPPGVKGQAPPPAPTSAPGVSEEVREEAREEVAAIFGNGNGNGANKPPEPPLTFYTVAKAWSPFAIMSVLLLLSGVIRQEENRRARAKEGPVYVFGGLQTLYEVPVPGLNNEVSRARALQKEPRPRELAAALVGSSAVLGPRTEPEGAVFKFDWVTAPGSSVFLAAVLSMLLLRMSGRQVGKVLHRTVIQMKVPIPTIACMLGLSFVTRYAGMDATLGIAFAETGVLYPFFAAILGWLGVFLTGTDAGSNALFGSLQKITATEVFHAHGAGAFSHHTIDQAQVLICTANSTGGVMGKMIDAQSICVATAGTNQIGREADIFKAVIWHSILLASIVGVLTLLQAYVPPFTGMVPRAIR